MDARTKLVTFRLSKEEFEHLRAVSEAHAARSVSEFVRAGVGWIVDSCDRRVWESIVIWAQGAFLPSRSSRCMERSRAGPEQTTADCDDSLEESHTPTEIHLALQSINEKIDRLYRLVRGQSGDLR
jgi:hypothetical protein